jgi:hypothetical protein
MRELFYLVVLTVSVVLAMRVALSEGMLLERVGKYFEDKVERGERVWDIIICPWCSGTLYSSIAHLFAFRLGIVEFEWNWDIFIRYPLVVFCSSFIAGLLWTIYLTINQIKEKNEAEANYLKNSSNNENN